MIASARRKRGALPKSVQVSIFRRDGWTCRWCGRPVVFAPAMKFLARELRIAGQDEPLAYFHPHWTRDGSPLLDELGAVIDHVQAFCAGAPDAIENLITACNKCNGRKSAASLEKWKRRPVYKPVKGRYGEPQSWDGLSWLFVMFAQRDLGCLTVSEKDWLKALVRKRLAGCTARVPDQFAPNQIMPERALVSTTAERP